MIFFVNEGIYHQSMTMEYDYHLCMNALFQKTTVQKPYAWISIYIFIQERYLMAQNESTKGKLMNRYALSQQLKHHFVENWWTDIRHFPNS